MDPSILLSLQPAARASRLEEIKQIIASPTGSIIWGEIKEAAYRERDLPPYLVDSVFPGRDPYSAKLLATDFGLCRGIGLRINRHALMFLVDGDQRWIDAALRQTDVLFDDDEYPVWNHFGRMRDCDYQTPEDLPKLRREVHLRTGALAREVSIMLNWLRPHLDPSQLEILVRGLEKRAIRPYQEAIKKKPWWIDVNNNWLTCIVGGLGVCGMALDGLHPDAQSLVDFADPLMERHLEDYGPAGEFNEGMGYAGAVFLVVDYFAARLGWKGGTENRLATAPFPAIARWYLQMTAPPGHLFAYGDGHPQAPLRVDWISALASATQDPVLQGFAEQYRTFSADPVQFLYHDPELEASSPQGHLPLGAAFPEHGACITSRTSWDADKTASVVGSKARREDNHEHNDPGQVVIYGEGQPLIVDWGTPSTYPAKFFTMHRFDYFEGSAFGHNILVFGGREMESCYEPHPKYTTGILYGKSSPHAQGHIVSSTFDDNWGGQWSIDTTEAWSGVTRNLRTVLHIHPGFVVVLDEAQLEKSESISLRWNVAQKPLLHGEDGFILQLEPVGIAARIINLEAGDTLHRLAQHAHHEPWNKDQFGGLLPERDCPYFETLTEGDHCRLLSLFSVQPGPQTAPWTQEGNTHTCTIGKARLEVVVGDSGLTVNSSHHDKTWEIPFRKSKC